MTITVPTDVEPAGSRDSYAPIADLDEGPAARLAERFEIRASDPRQHRLWSDFLARAPFVDGARILEVGCGTGIITAKIAELPGVAEAAGADPSPYFVERARRRASLLPHDPLQPCVEAAVTTLVHAPWLVRRLSRLVRHVGFQPGDLHSHGHLELDSPAYMPSLIDVGADRLATTETVSTTTAAALKAEARDRADRGRFFGHIAYASLLATRTP